MPDQRGTLVLAGKLVVRLALDTLQGWGGHPTLWKWSG